MRGDSRGPILLGHHGYCGRFVTAGLMSLSQAIGVIFGEYRHHHHRADRRLQDHEVCADYGGGRLRHGDDGPQREDPALGYDAMGLGLVFLRHERDERRDEAAAHLSALP